MKRWWIIYDKSSQFVEYHNIINFIKYTFSTKRISFKVIASCELTKEHLLKLQRDRMLPDIALFWCSKNFKRKLFLSKIGVAVINGYRESFICENKYLQLKILSQEKDVIPNTIFTDTNSIYKVVNNNFLSYPLVLKLSQSTLGSGVYIVNSIDKFNSICLNISATNNANIMLQEYLNFCPKRVTKVCFYNNQILSCYNQDESDLSMHFITSAEEKLIFKTINALKLNFGSIDIIYQSSTHPLICEVNNLPNILKIYKITNVNIIEKIIDFYS